MSSNDPSQPGYSKYRDRDYRGEKTPKHLSEGPKQTRICTDCLCCIIFIAFWVGTGYIGIWSFNKGDPNDFLYPYDMSGTQCGLENGAGYPFLLWNYYEGTFIASQTFCVQSCPTSNTSTVVVLDDYDSSILGPDPYQTKSFAGRLCIPVSQTF